MIKVWRFTFGHGGHQPPVLSLFAKATDLLLRVLSTNDPVMPAKKEKQPLEDAMNQRRSLDGNESNDPDPITNH